MNEPAFKEVTFQRFCNDILRYELTPWQSSWAYRIDRGDAKIGFNFRTRDSTQAMDLLAMASLWRGIVHGQVSYVLCKNRGIGREFNRISLDLLNQSERLKRLVEVQMTKDFFKFRDTIFGIVISNRMTLTHVESGHDVYILESDGIPGARQISAMKLADRVFYPRLSNKVPCASRPTSRKRS